MKEDFELLLIIGGLEHHEDFTVCQYKITKNIVTNTILKISLSQKPSINVKWHTVVGKLRDIKKDNIKIDRVISSIVDLSTDSVHYPLYGMKNESEMIENYIQNIGKFKTNHIEVQMMEIGTSVFRDIQKEKVSVKLNYEEIEIETIATMFAIDYVKNERARALMKAYQA